MKPKGNYAFHTGYLFSKGSGANPATRRIATLQEVSFSFKGTNKTLQGEMQFAEAIGRSDIAITGKAKTGLFNADAFNDIFFNQAAVIGHKKIAYDEPGVIGAGALVAVNGANYCEDLGVAMVVAGVQVQMLRVAAAPAGGQYSVNEVTGSYSFAVADNGKAVLLTYAYKNPANGKTIPIANVIAGAAPTFQAIFFNQTQGETVYLKLNAAVSENLDFGFKNGDFAMPDFSFAAQQDVNGNIGEYSQSQG